jgi:rRNA maturation endonuclease Nob1
MSRNAVVLSCGSCGVALPLNSRFCNACGASITQGSRPAEYKQVTVLAADVHRADNVALQLRVGLNSDGLRR